MNIAAWSPSKMVILIVMLFYAALFYYFAHDNIYLGFSEILGLISFPFLINKSQRSGQYGYLIAAVLFSSMTLVTNSFAIFYFSFVLGLCFLIRHFIGKFNLLPFFLLILISPLLSHVSAILSFPIRLKLSAWVSQVLSMIGMDISGEGNLLILNGARFLVDQECVGLRMLISGLVLVLIALSYFEKKHLRNFNFIQISLFLLIGLALNILANFSRILVLVIYRIGPDHFMHDIVGMLCLVFFLLGPIVVLAMIYSSHTFNKIVEPSSESASNLHPALMIIPICLLFVSNHNRKIQTVQIAPSLDLSYFQKFESESLADGVKKFTADELLIYLKPPISAIRRAHDPRWCWRGSGYQLKQIQLTEVNDRSIYIGVLEKGEDRIYTAWWYQDGLISTTSEWTWRTGSLLESRSFTLLNFNSDSREVLTKEVSQYFTSLRNNPVE